EVSQDSFPDSVQVGSMNLTVDYKYEPGNSADGATISIPLQGLGQIDEIQTGWLIPGLNESRIAAMIKSLPKSLRRNLVPAPEKAKMVLDALPDKRGQFQFEVAKQLSRLSGEPISPDMFDMSKVASNLKLNVRVLGDEGELLAEGRDVKELKQSFGDDQPTAFVEIEDDQWNQDGLKAWDFESIPAEVEVKRGHVILGAFPAIIDQHDSVGLRLLDNQGLAAYESKFGVMRLFAIHHRKSLRSQANWLPDLDQHILKLSGILKSTEFRKTFMDGIAAVALFKKFKLPKSKLEFEQLLENGFESISIATQDLAKWLPKFAEAAHQAQLALEKCSNRNSVARSDIENQIQNLTSDRFLVTTPWKWLEHFPRYFTAISERVEKLNSGQAANDGEITALISNFEERRLELVQWKGADSACDPELEKLRWMIEEFRVSQFAQKLGTSLTVSTKRLEKQLERIKAT
ncbi:MAG: DUF3418 domain-containing protein, partial [Planctomycetota bacterium]